MTVKFHGFILSNTYDEVGVFYPMFRIVPGTICKFRDYDVCFFIQRSNRTYQIVNRDSPVSLNVLRNAYALGKLYYGPKSRAYLVPLNPSS